MATQTKQSSAKIHLGAEPRTIFGKNLKKFRHQGKVPANVFGSNFTSASISIELKDFSKVYRIAEETSIVYLKLGKNELPVLVRGVQRHPVTRKLLHVDFRKVDLTQKIETEVPIKHVGESEAVEQKSGVLLTLANTVKVESLPEDIPHEIEVDLSSLKEIGEEIKVSDLNKSDKYTVKEEADKVIVSVIAHKEESLVAETAVAEPEVITEVPKEGEEGAPAEEGKEEKASQAAGAKQEKQSETKPGKAPEDKKEAKKE